MSKTLCHLSGGFDSACSTLLVAEQGGVFSTMFFDINQCYVEQERKGATAFVKFLTDNFPLYEGHTEVAVNMALSSDTDVSAYIPVRNLVFGAMSANHALAKGYDTIAVGNKTLELRPEDPYCFNDCSKEFYDRLGELSTFASQYKSIKFIMPLVVQGTPLTKEEVIRYVHNKGFDLTKLWSCYTGDKTPCGECYHCEEVKKSGCWDICVS